MSKKKCIYCGSKISVLNFNIKSILTKNELRRFNENSSKKAVCEECQTQMFMLNLS